MADQQEAIAHGYLDDVVAVFEDHQHPIIVVEEGAMRWMGLRVFPWEDIDLLVRDSHLHLIISSITRSNLWELVPQNLTLRYKDTYLNQVPRLRRLAIDGTDDLYLGLFSESVYHLAVDGDTVQVPDIHALNDVVWEERFYPGTDTPAFTRSRLEERGLRILHRECSQSNSTVPIFVPTIPRMIDALWDQSTYTARYPENYPNSSYRPNYHLGNFVRYLYLEAQPDILQFLEMRNRELMQNRINTFKRKPVVTLASLKSP